MFRLFILYTDMNAQLIVDVIMMFMAGKDPTGCLVLFEVIWSI